MFTRVSEEVCLAEECDVSRRRPRHGVGGAAVVTTVEAWFWTRIPDFEELCKAEEYDVSGRRPRHGVGGSSSASPRVTVDFPSTTSSLHVHRQNQVTDDVPSLP